MTSEITRPATTHELSIEKAQALRYLELILALHHGSFASMQHAISYLLRELYNSTMRKTLKELLDNRGNL
jgi:hypothetical protein